MRRYSEASSSPETQSAHLHARRHGPALVAGAREDEAELGPLVAEQRERLEESGVVLVRPRTGRIEQELLSLLVARMKPLVVDAPRDRVDALRRDAEQLDRAPPDELARHDHGVGLSRRPLVRARSEEPLGAREELGMVEVLQVVHRHRRRDLERRQRDRERVVDGVEPIEASPQAPGRSGGERHRERPLRDDCVPAGTRGPAPRAALRRLRARRAG